MYGLWTVLRSSCKRSTWIIKEWLGYVYFNNTKGLLLERWREKDRSLLICPSPASYNYFIFFPSEHCPDFSNCTGYPILSKDEISYVRYRWQTIIGGHDLVYFICGRNFTPKPNALDVPTDCILCKFVKWVAIWFLRCCWCQMMLLIVIPPIPNESEINFLIYLTDISGSLSKFAMYTLIIRSLSRSQIIWNNNILFI